jgi:hypothetical protein
VRIRLRAVLAKVSIDRVVDGWPQSIYCTLGPLGVGAGMIADRLQFSDALLQHEVGEIGDAVLDRVIESLELGVGLGRPLPQLGDMGRPALGSLLPAVEHRGQDFLKTVRL